MSLLTNCSYHTLSFVGNAIVWPAFLRIVALQSLFQLGIGCFDEDHQIVHLLVCVYNVSFSVIYSYYSRNSAGFFISAVHTPRPSAGGLRCAQSRPLCPSGTA